MGAGNTRTGSDHHQDQTLIDGCRITCFFQPRPARHTWLLALTRAALGWIFIGVNVMLQFSQWPEMLRWDACS